MHYFITGGTGFIGAYATRLLVGAGHTVTTYDIAPDREFLAEMLTEAQRAQVSVVHGDVTDLAAVLRAMRAAPPQRVIHLAALLSSKSNENPLLSLKVNCEGSLNLFEAVLDRGVERIVWASSVGVFGLASKRPPGAIDNEAPHTPTDLYGSCKSLVERFSKHYRRAFGLECVGLRYAGVYGYGKSRTQARGTGAGFMEELIEKPALAQPGIVPAGEAVLDFVHVEDAARATVLAAETTPGKRVALNIGGFRGTLREAAEIVKRAVPGADLTVEDGSWNGINHHYDLTAAQEAIGYSPRITLEEGIPQTIREIRRRAGFAVD